MTKYADLPANRAGILTPCIGTCKIDCKTGKCKGCHRTREQLKNWRSMSQEQRAEAMRELKNDRHQG